MRLTAFTRNAALLVGATLASATLLLAGCASAAPQAADTATSELSTTSGPQLEGELVIYAAASLQASFDELAAAFETLHPSLDVVPIVYDGSSTLVTQLLEGAPADIFASANEANMDKAVAGGIATGAEIFTSNTLVVATPTGNPGKVTRLADLSSTELTLVVCAPEVPCGAASQQLFELAGVTVTPASFEQNVSAVLTKVAADEADAGIVYATDVKTRTDVEFFVPDEAAEVINHYPIVALTDAPNTASAAAFVAFVLSTEGQAVLESHGFGAP